MRSWTAEGNLLLVMTSRRFFLQYKISFTCQTSQLTIIYYLSSALSLTIIYYLSSALSLPSSTTFLLRSAASFCSSLDLVETFKTVGELAGLSITEHLAWSFSWDFCAMVSRPRRARISSWECLNFSFSPSNRVCVEQCAACNAFTCSCALQSCELS